MRRLKIGLFLEHYDPFTSGVITYAKALRAELERRGHSVYIICPAAGKFRDQDSHIIRIPGIILKGIDNTSVGVPTPLTARRIARLKLDVIHAHEVYFVAGLAYRVAKKQNIPFIQNFHTLWDRFSEQARLPFYIKPVVAISLLFIYSPLFGLSAARDILNQTLKDKSAEGWLPRFIWAHMKFLARRADAVIVPSAHLEKRFTEDGIDNAERIPNGVANFQPSADKILPARIPGRLRVICVARLSGEKRVNVLIAAAKKYADCELILVGDGPARARIVKQSAGLRERFRFMGRLDNTTVRQLMSECDVLALSSYNFDNQPMVIDEALAAGLPIIYCDPNLTEGLTPDNALLVGRGAEGFADGFERLSSKSLRQKMSQASGKIAAGFSIERVADQVEGVYFKVLRADRQN